MISPFERDMREHKFRAWDRQKEKMIYNKYEFDARFIGYMSFTIDDNNKLDNFIGFGEYTNRFFQMMEYTGSKDRYGKETCEGDIVWSEGHQLHFTVEYQLSMAGFMLCSKGLKMGVGQNAYVMEIIGNIHENPELLNSE